MKSSSPKLDKFSASKTVMHILLGNALGEIILWTSSYYVIRNPHKTNNFCQLRKCPMSGWYFFPIPPENMRIFSGGIDWQLVSNGLNQNQNWKKRALLSWIFAFSDACFWSTHKTNPTKCDWSIALNQK